MQEAPFKVLHSIQLVSVDTRELYIRVNGEIGEDVESLYKKEIKIGSAHSAFDKDKKIINVGLRLTLGMDKEEQLPISMRIEIMGTFSINTDEFPEDQIEDWAVKNAPFILYPFVREHGFALPIRCGLPPLILPLVQVPTIEKNPKAED